MKCEECDKKVVLTVGEAAREVDEARIEQRQYRWWVALAALALIACTVAGFGAVYLLSFVLPADAKELRDPVNGVAIWAGLFGTAVSVCWLVAVVSHLVWCAKQVREARYEYFDAVERFADAGVGR